MNHGLKKKVMAVVNHQPFYRRVGRQEYQIMLRKQKDLDAAAARARDLEFFYRFVQQPNCGGLSRSRKFQLYIYILCDA